MPGRLGVVYLVWGPLGPQAPKAFLSAYRQHAAGVAHELIVAFNGVARQDETGSGAATRAALLDELEGVEHRLVELERPVVDLAAYLEIARGVEHDQLCFLNTYSEPLVDGWLALLARPANQSGVGAVGATGSWGSHASHVRYILGLGGPYRGVYDDRESTRRLFAPPSTPVTGDVGDAQGSERLARRSSNRHPLRAAMLIARQPRFPAPHLRTNAFLLERELMLTLKTGPLADKAETYLLESGRHSLKRQIERLGLQVLVAGRDGAAYGAPDWPQSQTFWQGAQENLVIADNQTRAYERGDYEVRRALSGHAWGALATPAEPGLPPRPQAHAGADGGTGQAG